MAVFGNRQLSVFFLPVVELRAKGFVFKGRQYSWGDVEKIELWQEPRFPVAGPRSGGAPWVARARIWLQGGKSIAIKDVAFEKKGEPLKDGYSSAFDELIATFKLSTKRGAGAGRDLGGGEPTRDS
jgi:hypothetical protein